MSYLRTVIGSEAFLNAKNPNTWNITLRLERHPKYIPTANPHLQPYNFEGWAEKSRALGLRAELIDQDPGKDFLKRIRESDVWTAHRLRSKADALATFPFRVLTKDGQRPPTRNESDEKASFLCLSYRWWSERVDRITAKSRVLSPALRVDGYNGNFDIPERKLPISDCMWNALLAERNSEAEGIWVDQMCINQDDDVEVHSAVSSMNLLYMAARKVVVVMEDVVLWSDEVRAMIKHAEQINSIPVEDRKKWTPWTATADPLVLGASACGLFKIEGSSWFRRVWCNHELQVGREFVFMIPVMEREPPPQGIDSVCVLKLDAKALATLIEASRQLAGPRDLEAFLWRGWLDNIQEDMYVGIEPRVFYGFNAATNFSKQVATPEKTLVYKANGWPSIKRTAIELLSEALQLDEANPRDILAVLLNTLHPTLAYRGSTIPTISEIVWLMNTIALAAGDVSPLLYPCQANSWAERTIEGVPFERHSWAAWPDQQHVSSRVQFAENIDLKYEIHDEGLKLVVAAIGSSDGIGQLQVMQAQFEDGPVYMQLQGMLQFERLLDLHERKLQETRRKGREALSKEKVEVHPRYAQHFVHAFLAFMSLDDMTQDRISTELASTNLLEGKVDVAAGMQAFESVSEEVEMFDVGTNLERFASLQELYTGIRPLVCLIEAIVRVLIGDEYQFKDAKFDPGTYISTIHGANPREEWTTLAGLPSKSEHGFFWLVRPDAVNEALVDFRCGGTWAVQVEGKDAKETESVDIWNKTGCDEGYSQKDLEHDALRVKLISRNIRLLPAEKWDRPLYTKTVIMHI